MLGWSAPLGRPVALTLALSRRAGEGTVVVVFGIFAAVALLWERIVLRVRGCCVGRSAKNSSGGGFRHELPLYHHASGWTFRPRKRWLLSESRGVGQRSARKRCGGGRATTRVAPTAEVEERRGLLLRMIVRSWGMVVGFGMNCPLHHHPSGWTLRPRKRWLLSESRGGRATECKESLRWR